MEKTTLNNFSFPYMWHFLIKVKKKILIGTPYA